MWMLQLMLFLLYFSEPMLMNGLQINAITARMVSR